MQREYPATADLPACHSRAWQPRAGMTFLIPARCESLCESRVSDKCRTQAPHYHHRGINMAELKNRRWLIASRPQGLIKESDFQLERNHRPRRSRTARSWCATSPSPSIPTQRGWMSMDTYMPGNPRGTADARGSRRTGRRVQAARLRQGRPDSGPARMGGLHGQRGRRHLRDAKARGRDRPDARPLVPRHHRTDRLLRHPVAGSASRPARPSWSRARPARPARSPA